MSSLSKNDLIDYLEKGCKAPSDFKIGVEHEQFIFDPQTWRRVPYPAGIQKILEGFQQKGWQGVYEQSNLIAVTKNHAAITLEPGGQFELSGAPYKSLHDCAQELKDYFKELQTLLTSLGLVKIGMGYDPISQIEEIPWMPKDRYGLMRTYMPQRGTLGLEMMANTCTVQANLDFSSETDMVRKFRIGLALQPVATALFAHSPLRHRAMNGYQSFRRHIWNHTDPDRCGLLPFVFEAGMGFERYVDYALEVPMYFVKRQGRYIDATGQSFRSFLQGKLEACPGEMATLEDWEDHLTTIFSEVRLKRYLEMRGADSGPEKHINALAAFWTGLIYDEQALQAAEDLIQQWSLEELQQAYQDVAQQGLDTKLGNRRLQEIVPLCLGWARTGLQRRQLKNTQGQDESLYLEYLEDITASSKMPAHRLLNLFTQNSGDMTKVLTNIA